MTIPAPAHTPGPWGAVPMVNGARGAFHIVGNREGNNAEVDIAVVGPTLSKSAEANARLIAAAPALVAALQWAYDTLQEINPSNYDHDDVCALNAASVEVILGIKSALSLALGEQ